MYRNLLTSLNLQIPNYLNLNSFLAKFYFVRSWREGNCQYFKERLHLQLQRPYPVQPRAERQGRGAWFKRLGRIVPGPPAGQGYLVRIGRHARGWQFGAVDKPQQVQPELPDETCVVGKSWQVSWHRGGQTARLLYRDKRNQPRGGVEVGLRGNPWFQTKIAPLAEKLALWTKSNILLINICFIEC